MREQERENTFFPENIFPAHSKPSKTFEETQREKERESFMVGPINIVLRMS